MKIEVIEIRSTPNSTASMLFVDGAHVCFVIEDGHRAVKVAGATRIPAGTYKVAPRREGAFFEKYARDFRHRFVPQVLGVPDFQYILIHVGNFIQDTRGCLLVNRAIGIGRDGHYFGIDSTSVYKDLYAMLARAFDRSETVTLTITRAVPTIVPA